jgi:hypothetical protein
VRPLKYVILAICALILLLWLCCYGVVSVRKWHARKLENEKRIQAYHEAVPRAWKLQGFLMKEVENFGEAFDFMMQNIPKEKQNDTHLINGPHLEFEIPKPRNSEYPNHYFFYRPKA